MDFKQFIRLQNQAYDLRFDDTFDPKHVELGQVQALDLVQGMKAFFRVWTVEIDRMLERLDPHCEDYHSVLDNRFFTYEELGQLYSQPPEDDYPFLPAFVFLGISNMYEKDNFIIGTEYNDQSYWEAFQRCFPHPPDQKDINDWRSFFFARLKARLPIEDMKRHTYISGGSGSGKSEAMKMLFYHLMNSSKKLGNGTYSQSLVLLDPHGDLYKDVVDFGLYEKHPDRLIVVSPTMQSDYYPVINPFDCEDTSVEFVDHLSQELAKSIQSVMKDDSSMTQQMETIVKPVIATLLFMGGKDLRDLQIFLQPPEKPRGKKTDETPTAHELKYEMFMQAGKNSPIASHRHFFEHLYETYTQSRRSIATRLQGFLNSPVFSNMVTGESSFSLEHAINSGKVVLFHLPKGEMGSDTSVLMGKFVLSLLQSYALKRAKQPAEYRKPTFVFVDECQNFVSSSLGEMLTESRKFGLHLVLANQFIGQEMSREFTQKLLSNTNVKLVGKNDANTLSTMAKSLNMKVETLQEMKKFSFALQCGERDVFTIKIPDYLVRRSKRFYLSESHSKKMRDWQLKKYYKNRPLASVPMQSYEVPNYETPITPDNPAPKPDTRHETSPKKKPLKPKFGL